MIRCCSAGVGKGFEQRNQGKGIGTKELGQRNKELKNRSLEFVAPNRPKLRTDHEALGRRFYSLAFIPLPRFLCQHVFFCCACGSPVHWRPAPEYRRPADL